MAAYQASCFDCADPHFHTWDKQVYDFHGEWDLILIKNKKEGIHLHIHTEPQTGYAALISHAVVVSLAARLCWWRSAHTTIAAQH